MDILHFGLDGDIQIQCQDGKIFSCHTEILEKCCDLLQRIEDSDIQIEGPIQLPFPSNIVSYNLKVVYDIQQGFWCGSNGFLVPLKDENGVYDCIQSLRFLESLGSDDSLNTYGQALIDTVVRHTNDENWLNVVKEVYQDPSNYLNRLVNCLVKTFAKNITRSLLKETQEVHLRNILLDTMCEYHEIQLKEVYRKLDNIIIGTNNAQTLTNKTIG